MGKLFELSRRFWVEAQLVAPPPIQRAIVPHLHEAKDLLRSFYLPVYQWSGQGHGGALVVTYAGHPRYTTRTLKSLLFAERAEENEIGRIPFWKLSALVDSEIGDITIIEAVERVIRTLPASGAIVLPFLVQMTLDVQGDWRDVRLRIPGKRRRDQERIVRKCGYSYEVSNSEKDFEMFYHQMYLPTAQRRYGELAGLATIEEVYPYFRHGRLLFVKRNDIYVSAFLCLAHGDVVHAKFGGVFEGDPQLIQEGAQGTVYYATIRWANQQEKYKAVNLEGCLPYLDNPVFRYKRSWGTSVSVAPHLHGRTWIKSQRNIPAVRQFLKDNPFITVDKSGRLQGLIVVDDPDKVSPETKAEWRKCYETLGLDGLLVRSVADIVVESERVGIEGKER
jgi:hypothetical protein